MFTGAEAALWSYLAASADYQALGLHEYRAAEGQPVPFDPQGGFWAGADLPAIATSTSTQIATVPVDGRRYDDQSTITLSLIYPTRGEAGPEGDASRSDLDAAAAVVLSRLASRQARHERLGQPDIVRDVEVIPSLIQGYPQADAPGTLHAWEARFAIRITTTRGT